MLSRLERAKQFLPFDALKGLQEALREKEVQYVEKIELSDEKKEEICRKMEILYVGELIYVTYYNKNHYTRIKGKLLYINPLKKSINVSKIEIPFDYIKEIDIA